MKDLPPTPPLPPPTQITTHGWAIVDGYTAKQLRDRDAMWMARIEEAVKAERERCAKLCDAELLDDPTDSADDTAYDMAVMHCAAAIRSQESSPSSPSPDGSN